MLRVEEGGGKRGEDEKGFWVVLALWSFGCGKGGRGGGRTFCPGAGGDYFLSQCFGRFSTGVYEGCCSGGWADGVVGDVDDVGFGGLASVGVSISLEGWGK